MSVIFLRILFVSFLGILMTSSEYLFGDDCNTYKRSFLEMIKTYPPDPDDVFLPPRCGKKAEECDENYPYYRIDGSCNNLLNPEWGMPNSTYSRLLKPAYDDGIVTPRMATDHSPLPAARRVRMQLFPTGSKVDQNRSLVAMQWAQIITHDMSLLKDLRGIRCCSGSGKTQENVSKLCFPIKINHGDPLLGSVQQCMNFSRSMTDKDIGCSPSADEPAQQINTVTSWMDLSLVYDISNERSDDLRSGQDGRMKVVTRKGSMFPPQDSEHFVSCGCNMNNETICYKGGDSRINQSPDLALVQIILLREHNRLASELKKINPFWDDEKLFQEARKINIAQYQHISYYEWMPEILGYSNLVENEIIFPNSESYINDYNCSVFPDVSNEHAHGAFRHFHSQIADTLKIYNEHGQPTDNVSMTGYLHRPGVLENNFAGFTRGLISQPCEDADGINVLGISHTMFACKERKRGIDLRSFDIQRDRDHANRYYNDYREYCGLPRAETFDDFGDYISKTDIEKLKRLYQTHEDVDLMVGGSLEKKYNGAEAGPTFLCILLEQFKRTRQSDRLWFEHIEAGLTEDQLAEIRKSSLSRLFCDNEKGIGKIQANAFLVVKNIQRDLVPCHSIPAVNLSKWKEEP